MTSAISVGIVGGVKIIPQWIAALLISGKVDTNIYHLVGAGLLIVSSICWTRLKYGNIQANVEEMQRITDHMREEGSSSSPGSTTPMLYGAIDHTRTTSTLDSSRCQTSASPTLA